jgi:hypothetical protein
MIKISLAALNTEEVLTATAIRRHPRSPKVVIFTFANEEGEEIEAMASIAKHFNGEDPLFLDDSNRLIAAYEIVNDWILPVGGGAGLTLQG